MIAKITDPMKCEVILTYHSISNMNEVSTIVIKKLTCLIVPSKHALY